jgi:hypothetical protein
VFDQWRRFFDLVVVDVVALSVEVVLPVEAESPVVPVVDIVSDDVDGLAGIVESVVPVVVPVPVVPAVPPGMVWPPVVPIVPPVPVVVPVCANAAVDRPSAATANIMLLRIVSLQVSPEWLSSSRTERMTSMLESRQDA